MKKIIIPIDFSSTTSGVLNFASYLGEKIHAKLIFVHFLPTSVFQAVGLDPGNAAEKNFSEEILRVRREAIKGEFVLLQQNLKKQKLSFEFEIRTGEIEVEFSKLISEYNPQQIILSETFFNENFQNNFLKKLIRKTNISLIIVPKELDELEIKNILFSTDFPSYIAGYVQQVKSFARVFEAELHIVKLMNREKFSGSLYSEKRVTEITRQYGLQNAYLHYLTGQNEISGIIKMSKLLSIDLICICLKEFENNPSLDESSTLFELPGSTGKPVLYLTNPEKMKTGIFNKWSFRKNRKLKSKTFDL